MTAETNWKKLWMRGGFPESLLAPTDDLSFEWRRSFIRSYTERDLPLLGLSAEPMLIRRFWQMLAGNNAGIWQSEKYANSLNVHHATVKRYADFLEHAYLIDRLYPWFPNVSKRLVKSPKVYQSDTGLLHTFLNINFLDDLLGSASLGASWEAFAIRQIKTALQGRLECYFYRTHQGAECDLVLVSGTQPLAGIEIKFGATPAISKGFYTAIADLKTPNNYVLISEGASFQLKENLWVVSLADFLNDHLPKLR
ncbi:MAG: DUF4143 domain-containing protein [Saprospiraceae bacterium]